MRLIINNHDQGEFRFNETTFHNLHATATTRMDLMYHEKSDSLIIKVYPYDERTIINNVLRSIQEIIYNHFEGNLLVEKAESKPRKRNK